MRGTFKGGGGLLFGLEMMKDIKIMKVENVLEEVTTSLYRRIKNHIEAIKIYIIL